MTDRLAIRIVTGASLVFGVTFAAVAVTLSGTSTDFYHQFGSGIGVMWAVFAVLYGILLYRERTASP